MVYGPQPDLSVGVLLGGMDKVLSSDPVRHRMRVQAGMTVKQLLEAATEAGMSVPLGVVPAFADLMLGGVLLTGAHGTNFGGASNLVRPALQGAARQGGGQRDRGLGSRCF
jgi:FAD/FMN-containing dehydrogenase